MEERLARLIAGRQGAFRAAEARTAGYSSEEVRARLASGRWLALRRGVYVDSHLAERAVHDEVRWHLLVAEGVAAAASERLTFSHGTAVRFHGLAHLRDTGSQVHITRAKRTDIHGLIANGIDLHVAGLPSHHVMPTPLFDVTTPARTVADMARYSSPRNAIVIGCHALVRRLTTRRAVDQVVRTMTRWPGVRKARVVTELLDARAETAIESLALAIWHEQGLPHPHLQVWAYDSHGFIGIVDGAWIDRGTVYETDGLVKYRELGGDMLTREKLRQERLEQAGLQVRRLTWSELWNGGQLIAVRLKRAFDRAAVSPRPRVRLYVGHPDRSRPVHISPVDETSLTQLGFELAYDGLSTPVGLGKWAG
ncbi:type IV toxin-antitoxin system AbiEi family antitoxin domain-containing protein [Tenggerimyces flavus]|uniref:Type IV toxin-antitoxin system AbiEi family antitoxin domain-containing protein n=1 Tax=Tenggerimyces flavus TaxID=1708749 RepID=A0ABV7YBG9_9ACTN|nr:type IV toxin-antitoxin system AbiEi family antitoxin domain-containing protein [Tenggerimyces flavus]MBM7789005.1 hypothetical protein [Tenggerimyces flavus]